MRSGKSNFKKVVVFGSTGMLGHLLYNYLKLNSNYELYDLSYRKKLWFELFGILILFLPFVILVLYYAVPFFELSWTTSERSTSANGLPARWFVKGFLVISFFLLLISGFSRITRIIETLRFGLEDKR